MEATHKKPCKVQTPNPASSTSKLETKRMRLVVAGSGGDNDSPYNMPKLAGGVINLPKL